MNLSWNKIVRTDPLCFKKGVKIMRRFESTQFGRFCVYLLIGIVFYLIDCLLASSKHPDVPWLERGIYAGGFAGFDWTIVVVVAGFGFLIFGKDK
jgi:hypothetical protein